MLPNSFFNNVQIDNQPLPSQDSPKERSNSAATSVGANPSSSAPTAQLSCELCRQRKVKCDKTTPCSTCRRAGATCIPVTRQRLPRGRVGGRKRADAELKARVGRLEKLVRSLDPTGDLVNDEMLQADTAHTGSDDTTTPQTVSSRGQTKERRGTAKYLGSQFWTDLSHEVNGLRDVLVESSDDETDDPRDVDLNYGQIHNQSNFDLVLFGPGSFNVDPTILQHPSEAHRAELCQIYRVQVDTMLKMIHGPSLSSFMEQGENYLDYPSGHPAVEALSFSVYYVAMCSQTEEQCQYRFNTSRTEALSRYRFATEVALARAGLVTTTDIVALQALLTYIIATRASDIGKRSWTLVGLAAQIARGMGLHIDPSASGLCVFEQEMRRRIWYTVGLLDIQSSLDRATNPAIPANSFNTRVPLNINDDEITPTSPALPEEREEYTTMTFAWITYQTVLMGKRLNWCVPTDPGEPSPRIETDWNLRREWAAEYQARLEKFHKYCNPSESLRDWQHLRVSQDMIAHIHLLSIRPLQKNPNATAPPTTGAALLKLAVEALERGWVMKTDPRGSPYRWLESIFVHWHPLAIAIAELCVLTKGDLVERAWLVVEANYTAVALNIADSTQGMLWRPIEKLMKRARGIRSKSSSASKTPKSYDSNATAFNSLGRNISLGGPQPANPVIPDQPGFSTMTTGVSPPVGNPNSFVEFDAWPFTYDFNDQKSDSNLSYSPGEAWDNWDTFVADMQMDNAGMLDMGGFGSAHLPAAG